MDYFDKIYRKRLSVEIKKNRNFIRDLELWAKQSRDEYEIHADKLGQKDKDKDRDWYYGNANAFKHVVGRLRDNRI